MPMNLVGDQKSTYDADSMAFIRHRRLRSLALIGVTLLVASCSGREEQPLTTFDPAGPFADRIEGLFWPVFWIATGVFVLVEGAIVAAVILFRDKDGRAEPKQLHGNARLEVLWTIIPALILAAIAVPSVSAIFDLTECGADAMEVEVVGHQWWFEFRYPDSGIETANSLVIPVNQEVCAQMTSEDVVHNFWVPSLNGKRYLIPGQTTELRLEADQVGEFWGHCAEFCGLSHSLMRVRVVALNDADFEVWEANQLTAASVPAEGTLEFEGWSVYQSKGCTQCHTVVVDAETGSNIIAEGAFQGPNLTHFASRDVFAGALLPEQGETHDEALKRWLANPPEVKPGSFMPNLALTEKEIDALIAWLGSNE